MSPPQVFFTDVYVLSQFYVFCLRSVSCTLQRHSMDPFMITGGKTSSTSYWSSSPGKKSHEIRLQGRLILLQEKESKMIIMFARRTIYSFQGTTKVSCYKYLHLEEKQKYHITSFARKTKVSYYITFFQTLLRMFLLRPLLF